MSTLLLLFSFDIFKMNCFWCWCIKFPFTCSSQRFILYIFPPINFILFRLHVPIKIKTGFFVCSRLDWLLLLIRRQRGGKCCDQTPKSKFNLHHFTGNTVDAPNRLTPVSHRSVQHLAESHHLLAGHEFASAIRCDRFRWVYFGMRPLRSLNPMLMFRWNSSRFVLQMIVPLPLAPLANAANRTYYRPTWSQYFDQHDHAIHVANVQHSHTSNALQCHIPREHQPHRDSMLK